MKQEDTFDFIRSISRLTSMSSMNEKDYKQRLLAAVKKEVKQVMEESVTRKCVHEDSGSVIALCAAVEACLSQGLRRRALGLFKTSSTTALLHKVAKHSEEAAMISRLVTEMENHQDGKSSSSSDSVTKKPSLRAVAKKTSSLPSLGGGSSAGAAQGAPLPKYLWIRLALFEKQLARIIDHLVSNAQRYYERDALVADPDFGNILSSLLVGPCALDYSKSKTTSDHFWSDPPADELIQRKMICSTQSTPPPVRRPINFKRILNMSAEESRERTHSNATSLYAKDYVESLHQNARDTLLFGKNNVRVLPTGCSETIAGYLSLHQSAHHLTIKWTPNQLINGMCEEVVDKSVYWEYAMQVRLDEIVYVHCHQDADSGGTVILVGQDGVQRPHIHFPKGGHTLAFLSCIETGLLPRGRLDPPLWSQQRTGNRKTKRPLPALTECEDINRDYVFRIIDNLNSNIPKRTELMDTHAKLQTTRVPRLHLVSSSTTSSESSTKSLSIDGFGGNVGGLSGTAPGTGSGAGGTPGSPNVCNIRAVCDSMKRQIISRAFYGWLAYCRHLSTVRTHLSGLVNARIIGGDAAADGGIDEESWKRWHSAEGVVRDGAEVLRAAYYGGVRSDDLRRQVWPYLLGHFKFGSTAAERDVLNEETKQAYENTMSEWLAVEAIVRQRDKESTANAIAKLNNRKVADADEQDDSEEESLEGTDSERKTSVVLVNGKVAAAADASNEENIEENQLQKHKEEEQHQQQEEEEDEEEDVCSDYEYVGNEVEACEEEMKTVTVANKDFVHEVIVTNASVDMTRGDLSISQDAAGAAGGDSSGGLLEPVDEETAIDSCLETHGLVSPACVSPASSNGGVYSSELLETFGLNLHRIEKDVQRCDRNFWYFASTDNLDKLRNVMCTYVWEHLDIGYMQGMCDLVAPLLVIFNDESLTYACFCHLMERMVENFPSGTAMDSHFANMRSLIQILDAEMYELMHAHGDYTHFYFCYRWFLLDFKRELLYEDTYRAWETIWAATRVSSAHFVLFLALAFLETYRDVILSNCMDFTDIIKFFNEMAEHHDATAVIKLARDLVLQLQLLIENK